MPHPDLVRWLIEGARDGRGLADLFAGYCERLAALPGSPVWRATLGLETLHPEESGTALIWVAGDEELRRTEKARAGVLANPSYLASPTRIVDETDRSYRRRLEGDLGDLPLLEELRAEGATDYLMLPLPFLDRTRTAVMSFATREPAGFDDAALAVLADAAALLSPYAERVVLRRIAVDLLAAYLGPTAGRRVFAGQVERGEVVTIEAAVWFCDLRGFTAISEATPRREVVNLLNRWFDVVGAGVEAGGGEILKFMGDGLLAVFPVDGDPAATCDRALDAAAVAAEGTAALNAELAAEGRAPLAFGLALHLGEVEFGNIGARHRLDFTAIGPAVNHASRIEGLTKVLGEPVLASAGFAAETTRPMRLVGRHALRGIEASSEVFAPAPAGGTPGSRPPGTP